MSAPTTMSWMRLKRLGRYLKLKPLMVIEFECQSVDSNQDSLDIYSDTDFAGCLRTRRSTNGGCAMRGSHCIRTWATTQAIIALSSGEAEFYGLTKAVCMGIGLRALGKDLGTKLLLTVFTDSTAAKGIAQRRGLGKLRHMDVQFLWIQERLQAKEFRLMKVLGTKNPGDALTKFLDEATMMSRMSLMKVKFISGRSSVAPNLT